MNDTADWPALGSPAASTEAKVVTKAKSPARDSSAAIAAYVHEVLVAIELAVANVPKDMEGFCMRVTALEDYIRLKKAIEGFLTANIHYGIWRGDHMKREALWGIEMPFKTSQKEVYDRFGLYLFELSGPSKGVNPEIYISDMPPPPEVPMWHGYNVMPF